MPPQLPDRTSALWRAPPNPAYHTAPACREGCMHNARARAASGLFNPPTVASHRTAYPPPTCGQQQGGVQAEARAAPGRPADGVAHRLLERLRLGKWLPGANLPHVHLAVLACKGATGRGRKSGNHGVAAQPLRPCCTGHLTARPSAPRRLTPGVPAGTPTATPHAEALPLAPHN